MTENRFRDERAGFPVEPRIFDHVDPAVIAAADARAIASIEAGQFVSHEAVVKWLKSWGTDEPLPPPKCGE